MRVKLWGTLICAILSMTGVGRAADVDAGTQNALTADYALRCTAAFNPNDANLDAAFALLAPEFAGIDQRGQPITRDGLVDQSRQLLKVLRVTACDNKVESFSQTDPNTVVAVNALHLAGTLQQPGGTHDMVLTEESQDTWKNVDGKWLEFASKRSQFIVKVDGTVVQGPGP